MLRDPANRMEYDGEAVYDPATEAIFFFHRHQVMWQRGCGACEAWVTQSRDFGLTCSQPPATDATFHIVEGGRYSWCKTQCFTP